MNIHAHVQRLADMMRIREKKKNNLREAREERTNFPRREKNQSTSLCALIIPSSIFFVLRIFFECTTCASVISDCCSLFSFSSFYTFSQREIEKKYCPLDEVARCLCFKICDKHNKETGDESRKSASNLSQKRFLFRF